MWPTLFLNPLLKLYLYNQSHNNLLLSLSSQLRLSNNKDLHNNSNRNNNSNQNHQCNNNYRNNNNSSRGHLHLDSKGHQDNLLDLKDPGVLLREQVHEVQGLVAHQACVLEALARQGHQVLQE